MLHRAVDVVIQHFQPLLAALLVVPVAAFAVGYVTSLGSQDTITARLWADTPELGWSNPLGGDAGSQTPAEQQASVMTELLQTHTFSRRVLTLVEPGYTKLSIARQQARDDDLRVRTAIEPVGTHVYSITYRAGDAGQGQKVIGAIISSFGTTIAEILADRAQASGNLIDPQIPIARAAVDSATSALQAYQQSHHLDAKAAATDPGYQSLALQTQASIDHYLGLLDQRDESQAAYSAAPHVVDALYRVVDAPASEDATVTWLRPALRMAAEAAAVIAAVEVLLVYVVARRDPRIRSLKEVNAVFGLRPLGSAGEASR